MTRDNLSAPEGAADWRELQKEQTRRRISKAVHELVAETGHVTVPRVAERSGVSPATIYRHFPDRESLLGAAAYEHVDTGLRPESEAISIREYRDIVRKIFATHASDMASVIAHQSTPAGRELRRVRGQNRRGVIEKNVVAAGIDPAGPRGRRLCAAMTVVASSRAFLEFHEMTDLTTEEAADTVAWAILAMTEATHRQLEIDDDGEGTSDDHD